MRRLRDGNTILLLAYVLIFFLFILNPNLFGNTYNVNDSLNILHPRDTLEKMMKHFNEKGIENLRKGDYENAEKFLKKSLSIKKKILSEKDIRVGNVYFNLGVLNQRIWKFKKALEYYSIAESIFKRIDNDYIDIGSIYVNESFIYRVLGDYQKAKNYCNHAIRIFQKQKEIDYNKLYKATFSLALISEYENNYSEAIKLYKKSILIDNTKNPERVLNAYSNMAICYDKLGKIETAKKYYLSSIDLGKIIYGINNPDNASLYMNYGIFVIEKLKDYEKGFMLYDKALQLYHKKYDFKHSTISRCLQNIGEYYERVNKVDSALYYYQQSLIAAEYNYNDSNVYSNPDVSTVNFNFRILKTLKNKSNAFYKKYLFENDLKDLYASFNSYMTTVSLIDKIRLRYDSEHSRFFISENEQNTYNSLINVSLKIYSATNNKAYLDSAFNCTEKGRAFSLLASIRSYEAKEFGGIPNRLLKKEHDVFRNLSLYEELIYEEKKKDNPDDLKIDIWEEKLFRINQEYEKLLNTFEEEYPHYYQLKYDTRVVSVPEIREELEQDECLLEYAISDSLLFIFVVGKDFYKVHSVDIQDEFLVDVQRFSEIMGEQDFSSSMRKTYMEYTDIAYRLYDKLIMPCREDIRGKDLVIIPAGLLSYLPFGALLTERVDTTVIDYRRLPYLIKDHTIGYSYSATLHFSGPRITAQPEKELLAFAPDYTELVASSQQEPSFLDYYRNKLIPIPWAKEEVRKISKIIKADVYMDEEASEGNYKKNAQNYDILHLAMHTIVDNENPMYSKLAFTQNVDHNEDGFLNTYEIYNMNYNARLAVLSSCNSGYGKLQKGEGVMSLARGFTYAGCPSIVMTLWEVSDKSGADLMTGFYRYLKKG
ncbi:MAG: CHAT domain-containing protein, partial [Chitinivibrionales bacterium]|nr:CHAT domain-containing protein [Chitinivibrionales bacterium]